MNPTRIRKTHHIRQNRRHPTRLHAVLLCLLTLCLLLLSCGGAVERADPLSYQRKSYETTVQGELDGLVFEAEIRHLTSEERDDLSVTFTAPAALSGITVARRDGEVTLSLGEICVPKLDGETGIAAVLRLFSLEGTVLSAEEDDESGELTAVLTTAGGEAYTVIVDSTDGTPRSLESDGIRVDILTFDCGEK